MALDPNIALGIKPAEPFDITKFQQLRNLAMQEQATAQSIAASQAQEQLARAQLPGVQAESDVRVRAQRFNTDVMANAAEFTNPDGTPNVTKFINYATGKGYYKEAQDVAAADLLTRGRALANATTEQQLNLGRADFIKTLRDHSALLLHSTPEEQRSQALQTQANYANGIIPGSGDELVKLFGTPDSKTGMIKVNPDSVNAARTATINAATQETQRLEFAQKLFTKEGQDPNSKISKDFREFIRTQTGGAVNVPESTSIFAGLNNPVYSNAANQYIQAQINPPGVRAEAEAEVGRMTGMIGSYDDAINAANSLPKPVLGTVIGTLAGEKYARLIEQHPGVARMVTAAQIHNQNPLFKNDQINIETSTPEILKAKLEEGRRMLQRQAIEAQGRARRPSFTAEPTRPQPGTPVDTSTKLQPLELALANAIRSGDQKAVSTALDNLNRERVAVGLEPATAKMIPSKPTTIKMVNRQGKVFDVHPTREAEAKAAGLRRVEK